MTATAAPAFRNPTRKPALVALAAALFTPGIYHFLGNTWGFLLGAAAAAAAGWVFVRALVHPRIYLGKRWALAGLAVSGAVAYLAFGDIVERMMWRHVFQLTEETAVYEDPAAKWRVDYPVHWGHQEQRVSGTTNHVFRPSKATPAMSFSVARRPNVGTEDLSLIVEGFFMNLPKSSQTGILEKEPTTLPSGIKGYRVVYEEMSRRIPLKNEVLFVLDRGNLYFLSVETTPLWFGRHRASLERLLFSLQLPE